MVGVLVVALGVPPVFHSLEEGEHLDNSVLVAGYVIMRVATIAHLAARGEARPGASAHVPRLRREHLDRPGRLGRADLPQPPDRHDRPRSRALLILFELAGPLFAELRYGRTPWHPHHIAERYGLLVIITLGEVVLGTILAISAVVERRRVDRRGGPHRASAARRSRSRCGGCTS